MASTGVAVKASLCDEGEISGIEDSTCTACPVSDLCSGQNASEDCDPGFYSFANELPCYRRISTIANGDSDPWNIYVPLGSIAIDGSIDARIWECPSGFECPYIYEQQIVHCPPGTYRDSTEDPSYRFCIPCPDHYYCPEQKSKIHLSNGYFSPSGTHVALKCMAGWYCD